MTQFYAFLKKEFLEQLRSGRLILVTVIFCLFGIMNPAAAKLTPFLFDMMSDQLAQTGINVGQAGQIEITAMHSWAQFYKNIPAALLIFLILYCGVLTGEYQKGTLVILITKGMGRGKIMAAKALTLTLLWTFGYGTCGIITYGYNAFFWDNSVAPHLFFAAFCCYLYGLWMISVILPASAAFRSSASVMLTAAGAYLAAYLVRLIPAVHNFSPAVLSDAVNLLTRSDTPRDYTAAVICTALLVLVNLLLSIQIFCRKTFA